MTITSGHTAELARYDLVDAAFAATRTAADRRLESLRNDYRVALDRMETAAEAVRIARIRLGQANSHVPAFWDRSSRRQVQGRAMGSLNRARAAQRRAVAALGAAYDALVAVDAAQPAMVRGSR